MVKTLESSQDIYGDIEISQEVIEVIAGKATHDVNGVYSTQKSFSSEVLNYFKNKEYRRGMQLSRLENGELSLDVYVYLEYGTKVHEVALAIQENVKSRVYYMTDVKLSEINVHIVGMVPVKTELEDVLQPSGE